MYQKAVSVHGTAEPGRGDLEGRSERNNCISTRLCLLLETRGVCIPGLCCFLWVQGVKRLTKKGLCPTAHSPQTPPGPWRGVDAT